MLTLKTNPDGTLSLLVESQSRQHLRELAHAVEHGQPIPRTTQRFLAAAARQILRGEDPVKALELDKPLGRPPEAKIIQKQQAIAWAVWDGFQRSDRKRGWKGRVYDAVAERFHCTERWVFECWEKYRTRIEFEIKQRKPAFEQMRQALDELTVAAGHTWRDQVQTTGAVAAALAEAEDAMGRELEALVSGTKIP